MRGRLLDSLTGWAATSCPIPITCVPAGHVLSTLTCWCPWASAFELLTAVAWLLLKFAKLVQLHVQVADCGGGEPCSSGR